MNPINPNAQRINPSINPNTKYKSLSVFIETHFFIILQGATYCFISSRL